VNAALEALRHPKPLCHPNRCGTQTAAPPKTAALPKPPRHPETAARPKLSFSQPLSRALPDLFQPSLGQLQLSRALRGGQPMADVPT